MARKTKICTACLEPKKLTAFPVFAAYKGGQRSAVCHTCAIQVAKAGDDP